MNSALSENLLLFLGFVGEPSGTRTRDPLIKSQMLYRPELTAHTEKMEEKKSLQGFAFIGRPGCARNCTHSSELLSPVLGF